MSAREGLSFPFSFLHLPLVVGMYNIHCRVHHTSYSSNVPKYLHQKELKRIREYMQRLKAAKAEAGSSAPDVAGVTAEAEKQRKLNLAAAQRFIKAGLGGDGSGAAPVKDIWIGRKH